MLSNVNTLMVAWALSLIVVVGGVLMLEATYTPEAAPTEEVVEPAEETASTDTATQQQNENLAPTIDQANAGSNELTGRPAPGQTTLQPTGVVDVAGAGAEIPATAIPELLEETPQGALPRIAEDGRTPFDVYAAPRSFTTATSRIAIMVTDLGLKARVTQRAIADLPKDVAFAFSPYSPNPDSWGERSRRAGHEVFLNIPMEPVNYPQNDPGPLTLLTTQSTRESIRLLRSSLMQMTGYVGVVNHMGSRFTAASESIRPVLDELKSRGLMFVDSRTTQYSRAAAMGRAIGLPVAINNGYIDDDLPRESIAAELKKLEQRATTQGAAMGMARPYPVSFEVIKVWAATLEERGFALVPVSSIANLQALPR